MFTVTNLKERRKVREFLIVAASAVERQFREISRRTEIGAKWAEDGVERVTRLREEVRLNGTKLEF